MYMKGTLLLACALYHVATVSDHELYRNLHIRLVVCETEVCVLSLSVLASMRPYACRDEGVPLKNALMLFMDLQLLYISWCKNTANTV